MARGPLSNAELNPIILRAAHATGLPPSLIRAVVQQESGGDPDIGSPAGARGEMQLMPATARSLGVTNIDDPTQNIMGGARYLASQLRRFGSIPLALAAYNAGPGAVEKYKGVPPFAETQAYVKNVQALEAQYQGMNSGTHDPAPGGMSNGPSQPQMQPVQPTGMAGAIDLFQHPSGLASQLQKIGGGAAVIGQRLETPLALPSRLTEQPTPQQQDPDHPAAGVKFNLEGPSSPNASAVVKLAQQYLGTKYQWGGTDPKTGFDCSGFAQFVYKRMGIDLPRTTYEQAHVGQAVDVKNLQPGDLLFFEPTKKGPGHEGMYVGHGQFIHAPHTGDVVKISNLSDWQKEYVGARRVA